MRRFGVSSLYWAAAFGLTIMMIPTRARADLTLYDHDGWSVYTRGMVAAHYQLMIGDADPTTNHGVLVGGLFLDGGARDARDNSLLLSRVRSGFIGSQIGFGINRQISENVHVSSLLAVSLNDISSSRGSDPVKGVDFREAWAALETPYGALKFGRMFSIFGSASGEVVLLAYRYALGSPCFAELATIGCASVGAGPIYAGFDAQMRYITPRVVGLEFQLAVSDPNKASDFYVLTPFPRLDAQLSYDNQFGPLKLRVIGQGLWEEIQGVDQTNIVKRAEVWGAMGSAILKLNWPWGGPSLGAGGWTGAGLGTRTVLEVGTNDTSKPLTFGGTNKELRIFRGFYGNVAFNFQGSALAAGGGILYVRPVISAPGKDDDDPMNNDVLAQQAEAHLVFTQQIDTVVLTAEYMRWNEQWHFGEKRDLNFGGVGANFTW
jgi:hypothetical protein